MGLPCPPCYLRGGGLLPHHFTLTTPKRSGIFSAALAVRPTYADLPSLSEGILPYGVRTFLSSLKTRANIRILKNNEPYNIEGLRTLPQPPN